MRYVILFTSILLALSILVTSVFATDPNNLIPDYIFAMRTSGVVDGELYIDNRSTLTDIYVNLQLGPNDGPFIMGAQYYMDEINPNKMYTVAFALTTAATINIPESTSPTLYGGVTDRSGFYLNYAARVELSVSPVFTSSDGVKIVAFHDISGVVLRSNPIVFAQFDSDDFSGSYIYLLHAEIILSSEFSEAAFADNVSNKLDDISGQLNDISDKIDENGDKVSDAMGQVGDLISGVIVAEGESISDSVDKNGDKVVDAIEDQMQNEIDKNQEQADSVNGEAESAAEDLPDFSDSYESILGNVVSMISTHEVQQSISLPNGKVNVLGTSFDVWAGNNSVDFSTFIQNDYMQVIISISKTFSVLASMACACYWAVQIKEWITSDSTDPNDVDIPMLPKGR